MTNPTPDIAGLRAVLSRAISLPQPFVGELLDVWQDQLSMLPELPNGTSFGLDIIAPGELLPPSTSNSENTNLYVVHPFRLFGVGKPDLQMAVNSYNTRQFPCNGLPKICSELLS